MTRVRVIYEFGDFILDVGQQRLMRRGTQEVLPLTPRVFDTLLYLVEHAGEALEKDALLRSIWPDVIVEENSLTQNISTLRQVLGETRRENRYIATLPRTGYRFVANVTRREPEEPTTTAAPLISASPIDVRPARRRITGLTLVAGLLIAASAAGVITWNMPKLRQPAAAGQTLAILPFKPLLPNERNESLELGMTESLISSLGKNSAQTISPLSSVRRFAALDQDPIAAGRALGVDAVLEGSLQRRDDRLRVSVRLLRVSDGSQMWAQNFDQDFTAIFEMQDVIATRVATALSMRWERGEATRGASPTQDPEAYALYASGRFAWTRQTEASLLQAIDFFDQAIERDPKYALAYCGLADSYAVLGVFGMRAPHEVFPHARRAAETALLLDPNLASAHSALGHVKVQYEHDWDGAARLYSAALDLDPSLALTYHRRGLLFAMQGDTERALAESARAQSIEPLWIALRGAAANFLYYAQRYGDSIRLMEEVVALDERADNARGVLIRSLIASGEYDRALAEIDKRPIQVPGSNAFRAQALALSGRRDQALDELDRVLALSTQRYVAAYDIAMIHAALADIENTFLWLERALEDRSTLINFMAQEPMLAAMREDPRFASLVQQVGIYNRVLPDE